VSRANLQWDAWVEAAWESLAADKLDRSLIAVEPVGATRVRISGEEVCLFSGNDYLGLSTHPAVRQAAIAAIEKVGLGPRGSPLTCGYTTAHERLEETLARLEGTERALLFPTGYAANLGAISSMADGDTEIFSDSLNHASIIDGCRLARRQGAKVTVYDHGDANSLEDRLRASERPRKLIVTDGVFSMEGDVAPLAEIAELKERYGALLLVDEAHGTLVLGERGAGAAEAAGVDDQVDLHVGTLSKAVGALGGFVACSEPIAQWLTSRGRSLVYSTSLPVPIVEAARAAIEVAQGDSPLRAQLRAHITTLHDALGSQGPCPIISVVLGDPSRALEASRALLGAGYWVAAIRPPTVPQGTSRLRITVSAAHEATELEGLISAVNALR
jgi:8-amino-7-oxononanoate synthase